MWTTAYRAPFLLVLLLLFFGYLKNLFRLSADLSLFNSWLNLSPWDGWISMALVFNKSRSSLTFVETFFPRRCFQSCLVSSSSFFIMMRLSCWRMDPNASRWLLMLAALVTSGSFRRLYSAILLLPLTLRDVRLYNFWRIGTNWTQLLTRWSLVVFLFP